jgi:hypothetical protein
MSGAARMERQQYLLTTYLDAIAQRTGLEPGTVNAHDPAHEGNKMQAVENFSTKHTLDGYDTALLMDTIPHY